jgi:hypothetical protein
MKCDSYDSCKFWSHRSRQANERVLLAAVVKTAVLDIALEVGLSQPWVLEGLRQSQ